jgi:hypothetical protein
LITDLIQCSTLDSTIKPYQHGKSVDNCGVIDMSLEYVRVMMVISSWDDFAIIFKDCCDCTPTTLSLTFMYFSIMFLLEARLYLQYHVST